MEIQQVELLKHLLRVKRHVYLDHNATTPVSIGHAASAMNTAGRRFPAASWRVVATTARKSVAIATAAQVCQAATTGFLRALLSMVICRRYSTALTSHANARMTCTADCIPASPAARLAVTVTSPITA